MMDTKGPEIRTTATLTGLPVRFRTGDTVKFVGDPEGATTAETICLNYPDIASDIRPGNRFLI
ncbi:pyruvate kinase, partial [Klebsiella oxytoca]